MASRPRTTRERTYRTMYVADVGGVPGNDHVVFNHPNGLCVVCLSERHPLCATAADDAPACVSVDWSCGKDARRGGRADASGGAKPLDPCAGVRGKKKRGANIMFEWGMTDSVKTRIEAIRGIGLLKGTISVHSDARSDRGDAASRRRDHGSLCDRGRFRHLDCDCDDD